MLAALAFGAVKTFVVDPRTVSTTDDLLRIFYETRESLPPIPCPVGYESVFEQMAVGRYDFISQNWAFSHDVGILYLADDSKLAKGLSLPAELVAYEDLASGKVVLAGIPAATGKLQSLAVVDAPEFAAYDGTLPLESHLMKELWPRRIVWTATLKPEADAWADLVKVGQASSLSAAPMMMAMSSSGQTTGFVIVQDGTNLSVNLPDEFTGADITLESSTNLVEGTWTEVLQTNAPQSGMMLLAYADIPDLVVTGATSTNSSSCPDHTVPDVNCTNCIVNVATNSTSRFGGVAFYRTSASSTNDPDGDLLDSVSEYGLGTDYLDPDSDDDLMADGYEAQHGLNPLSKFWEDETGQDSDGDGFTNLEEFVGDSDPFDNTSTPVGIPVLYVSGVDGNDTNSGGYASPFKTIGKGIAEATNGCRVVVNPGIYTGSTNKNLSYSGKELSVVGLVDNTPVVIDCENSGGGFVFNSGEGTNALLRGISIINGSSSGIACDNGTPTIHSIVVSNCTGGGLTVEDSEGITVSDSVFSGNGGFGISVWQHTSNFTLLSSRVVGNLGGGGYFNSPDVHIENCEFNGNTGWGGFYITSVDGSVVDSKVINNISDYRGGGVWVSENVEFVNVEVVNNRAALEGGGIFHDDYGDILIDSCVIRSNQGATGGGIYSDLWNYLGQTSHVRIENSIIVENVATGTNWYEGGGGLWLRGFNGNSFEIMNCTVASNHNAYGGGGFLLWSDDVAVANSIFWGNTPDQIYRKGGRGDVSHCCIEGGFEGGISWIYDYDDPQQQFPRVTGTNNVSGDPLLMPNYYRLSTGSSCIGKGSSLGSPSLDIDGEGRDSPPDIGADEFSNTDSDVDGLPDWMERLYGTDPSKPDTDGDGLDDHEEILTYGTDALHPDSDRDGLEDYIEINLHGTDPNKPDTDGDGLGDPDEITYGFDPVANESGCSTDSDGDGLSDFYERVVGSNPDADSDPTQGSATLEVLYPLGTQVLK